ncbi:MAG TPA: polysaccharide biosynthesis C-terminal domain-containing protein [Chitinophagaceae bacterium]|nr:polysaccharide biosynthesis C-terminal domain-containing protein [Chitinophagaceae bacterium]
MSNIRRQSIISSILIYVGFAFGALNTYLFTREGGPFTKEEYGLTGVFMAIGSIMMSLATLGMPSYINKFFPYYKDHLPRKKNDQPTIALLVSFAGFLLVAIGGFFLKDVVGKTFANSPQVVIYYYWLFPFGLGLTVFSVLEVLAWSHHKSILSNFFKEVQFRVFVTLLFVLTSMGLVKSFDIFIKIYAFLYLLIALFLFIYLYSTGKISFTFSISKVTRRFIKKIIALCSFVWGGMLIYTLAAAADTIIIALIFPNGAGMAGLFTFAQYLTSIIQAPQRSIIAASVAHLSQAWKDKDYGKINRIYQRSSINQLIFSVAVFCLIWLNYNDAIATLNLQAEYKTVLNVFLFMGLMRIIDMGTGVSGQIIATSTYWRFDFMTGLILIITMLPLTWILTKQLGLIGPAVANLISFFLYNSIRYLFLLRKFNMQPFTTRSLYALVLAGVCYAVCYFLFNDRTGIEWLIVRSLLFISLFFAGTYWMNLTPDLKIVLQSLKDRVRK